MGSQRSLSTDPVDMAAIVAAAMRAAEERREAEALAAGFANVDEYEQHQARIVALRADALERETRRRRMAAILSQVGARLTDAMVERLTADAGLDDTPAHLAVSAWLASSTPVLVLTGGTGSGKTIAAVRAMLRFDRAQFVRALRIGAHFERWSTDREDGIAPIDFGADLLVVDDLGQEMPEDRRAMPAIEEVLDQRKSERTRTLITTNLSAEQIRDRYSERIRSRLAECGTLRAVSGRDMRRRG